MDYFGSSCPLPGYRSLDAGPISVQGPTFGPVKAPAVPLRDGPVSNLNVYQAPFPPAPSSRVPSALLRAAVRTWAHFNPAYASARRFT